MKKAQWSTLRNLVIGGIIAVVLVFLVYELGFAAQRGADRDACIFSLKKAEFFEQSIAKYLAFKDPRIDCKLQKETFKNEDKDKIGFTIVNYMLNGAYIQTGGDVAADSIVKWARFYWLKFDPTVCVLWAQIDFEGDAAKNFDGEDIKDYMDRMRAFGSDKTVKEYYNDLNDKAVKGEVNFGMGVEGTIDTSKTYYIYLVGRDGKMPEDFLKTIGWTSGGERPDYMVLLSPANSNLFTQCRTLN